MPKEKKVQFTYLNVERVEPEKLQELTGEILTLEYVYLKTVAQWKRNARRHGLQKIINSIRDHGFKDPLKWEPELNDGQGGIVEGNGRDDALIVMFAEDKMSPPRGIKYDESADDWIIPVLFGVDAESQAAAESYAIDHNNTALEGAFSETEIMKLWKPEIAGVIVELSQAEKRPGTISKELSESIARMLEKKKQATGPIDLFTPENGSGAESGDGSGAAGSESGDETGAVEVLKRLFHCPKCGHVSEIES